MLRSCCWSYEGLEAQIGIDTDLKIQPIHETPFFQLLKMSDSEASAQVAAKGAYKADQIKGATAEEVM